MKTIAWIIVIILLISLGVAKDSWAPIKKEYSIWMEEQPVKTIVITIIVIIILLVILF